MGLVPADKRARLNQARVAVVNFQAFSRRDLFDFAPARCPSHRGGLQVG